MKRLIYIVALLCLCACQREPLYYATTSTATVRLDMDWSSSGITPNGVTVFAYKENGELYKRFDPISTPDLGYINLPIGKYTLVVMNDTPEEFAGTIDFEGIENINTLRAVGVEDTERTGRLAKLLATKTKTKADDEPYCIHQPDPLGVARIENVEITSDMVDYYKEKPENHINESTTIQASVAPENVLSTVNIKAHVKGLKYAKGTTLSFLRGASRGYYMGQGKTLDEQAAHAFILNNRTFDEGSDSDGTISATFSSFGVVEAEGSKYYLDINLVLIDGKEYPLTFDVSEKISFDVELTLNLILNLELEIEIPEVKEDETGNGFSTEVNEWQDIIQKIEM